MASGTKDDDWASKVESDLSRVCRLCLKASESLYPIFDTSSARQNLAHRIMSCAEVKVFEGDGLPTHVCNTCYNHVEKFYQFKLLCERSDSQLRGNLQNMNGGSDNESLDESEGVDMTKFMPEVILDEQAEEATTNSNNDQMYERNGESAYSTVEALLRNRNTIVKQEPKADNYLNGLSMLVGNKDMARAAIAMALNQRNQQLNALGTMIIPPGGATGIPGMPGPPRSRRCRGGEKAFKCTQCDKSYSFSSALSRHKAVHNTELRPHVCPICKKGFTHLEKLIRHQKFHAMDTVVTCEQCSIIFNTFSAYNRHKYSGECKGSSLDVWQRTPVRRPTVSGERSTLSKSEIPHRLRDSKDISVNLLHLSTSITRVPSCPPSEAAVAEGGGREGELPLSLVMKEEEEEGGGSEDGGTTAGEDEPLSLKAASEGGDAANDPQSVSSSDPPKGTKGKFECKVCKKCFATRSSLEVHSSIHTGVRPFVCSICQQAFRHKVNLMEHFQRKHSQVRPYQCDVCAIRFVTKQELVRHYRKHIGE